jgi:hypothetical protein
VTDGYDIAQVCLNGHVANSSTQRFPEFSKKYCKHCGAATISTCDSCNTPIQGEYHVSGVVGVSDYAPPAHCHACGTPFPWTQARIQAAKDLADELGLDVPERVLIDKSIEELLGNTPRAPAEAVRFKRIVEAAAPWSLEAFKQIMYSVLGERVKTLIWP